jgi:hypothetical protein
MKREKSGVHLLLGLLLLFSASVGLLYGDKKGDEKAPAPSVGTFGTLSVDQTLQELIPLVESRSREKIVESLTDISAPQALAVVKKIVAESPLTSLTPDDCIQIIYGVMRAYPVEVQYQFLDLILAYPQLAQAIPLVFIAAKSSYPQVIPTIVQWAEQQLSKMSELADSVYKGLAYAVKHNALQEVQIIHDAVSSIFTPQVATRLLWVALSAHTSPDLVTYLVKTGKADITSSENGRTLLVRAVEVHNLSLVKTLIGLGAAIHSFADPAVGTPLQVAIEKGYTDIELYLRSQGARED